MQEKTPKWILAKDLKIGQIFIYYGTQINVWTIGVPISYERAQGIVKAALISHQNPFLTVLEDELSIFHVGENKRVYLLDADFYDSEGNLVQRLDISDLRTLSLPEDLDDKQSESVKVTKQQLDAHKVAIEKIRQAITQEVRDSVDVRELPGL